MQIKIDHSQLSELTKELMWLPGMFARARLSAIKSTGWMVQQELRNHIEYGGTGWPELHPLTLKFRHKYGVKQRWVRRSSHPGPLEWLGKFSRYRVEDAGETIRISFGKSKSGKAGTTDPGLMSIVERAEKGETIAVTPAMRHMMAATRRGKEQVPGQAFFPLKASTSSLKIPKRPIFGPVWRKVEPRIMPWFDKKFHAAVDRYLTGTPKQWEGIK